MIQSTSTLGVIDYSTRPSFDPVIDLWKGKPELPKLPPAPTAPQTADEMRYWTVEDAAASYRDAWEQWRTDPKLFPDPPRGLSDQLRDLWSPELSGFVLVAILGIGVIAVWKIAK